MPNDASQLLAPPLDTVSPAQSSPRRAWRAPRANAPLMRVLGVLSRWLLLRGLPVLRRVPLVRDLPIIRGYFWIRRIDLPSADRRRLELAVNRQTVAFMGPNHPEFATDWLIDKEISTSVAPRMASWAERGIVSMAPRFWGMNNLVANDGGQDAKEYSVAWALAGEGVLLHPEGTVRWTNDRVHPLFPGIAQMAVAAAQRTDKPVYIVPLVWKYQYVGDVSARIHREMRLIEQGLGLPRRVYLSLPHRFHALQTSILEMQMRHFGYETDDASMDFFARQASFQAYLIVNLEQRYSIDDTESLDTRVARLLRVIGRQRPRDARGMAMAEEVKRLGEFNRDVYGTSLLTQEQLFESLKRLRDRLLRGGWRNTLANLLPRPFGPRVVHIGVPEPIRVEGSLAADPTHYERELLDLARARMQEKLDEINRRIAPEVERYAVRNPFLPTPPAGDRTLCRTTRQAP